MGVIHIIADAHDYGANVDFNFFRFLVEVDGLSCTAGVHAFEAFNAIVGVDCVSKWNRLPIRRGYCLSHPEVHVGVVRIFYWTGISAFSAAGTVGGYDVSWVFADFNFEVTDVSFDFQHVGIGDYLDVGMTSDIDHFWSFDTNAAIKGREGLVEQRHVSTDCFGLFDNIDFEPHVCEVECGADAAYSSSHHHYLFRH